jgi:O-antigen ligase
VFSIEASFVLFLFAGQYKDLGYLRSVPIDLTLLFCALTIALIGAAIMSGRLKPAPPSLAHLLMLLFSGFAVASLVWSSFDGLNIDKTQRFLFLTSPSFFMADIIARDPERRRRFVRLLVLSCCAILLYYAYFRYLLGIRYQGKRIDADTYQEYGLAAGYLFISCIAMAVLGSSKKLLVAAFGSGAALYLLLVIGGRGALMEAVLAIPLLALGLLRRQRMQSLRRLALLIGLAAVAVAAYLALQPAEQANEAAGGFKTLQRYEAQLSGENTRSMDLRRVGRQLALRMWLERPVFGWGFGEFRVADAFLEYPHNTALEILAEMGLVGGGLFFCLCVPAVRDSARLLGDRASA